MDWKLAIEKNRAALAQVVAGLFVLAGWASGNTERNARDGARPTWISRATRNHIKRIVLTTEAALRRLIVLFMRVHAVSGESCKRDPGNVPDFSCFRPASEDRIPCFPLFDPRKPLIFAPPQEHASRSHPCGTPRIWSLDGVLPFELPMGDTGLEDAGPENAEPAGTWPQDEEPTALLNRLAALDHALENLPQQAARLARLMARRESAHSGLGRARQGRAGAKSAVPLRPGYPPGFQERGNHMAGDILRECQGLVRDFSALDRRYAAP